MLSLLALLWSFSCLRAQEASGSPADSLLAIGDSLGAYQLLDSLSSRLVYRDQAKAMIYARQALEIAKRLDDPEPQVRQLLHISEIYFVVSEFPRSLEYALQAEQIALKENVEAQMGNLYNSIGNIFFMQENGKMALENWEKALAYRRKMGMEGAVAGSLNNIAKELVNQKDYDKAQLYLEEARKINRKNGNWTWEVFNLMNFQELYLAREDYAAARSYAQEGLSLAAQKGFTDATLVFLVCLANLDELEGRKEAAYSRYLAALETPISPGNQEPYLEALSEAARLAQEKGDFQKAVQLQDRHLHLQDSLHDEEIKGELANVEIANELIAQSQAEEFARKEQEMARQSELKKTQLRSYIYLLGLGIVLVGSGGLLFGYLQKRKRNRDLSDLVQVRTQHLQASNEQLNTFIYKSSHELYGPVKSLQGLLTLAREHPSEAQGAIGLMSEKVGQLDAELRSLIQTMELRNGAASPSRLDLGEEIRAAIESLSIQPGFGDMAFRVEGAGGMALLADHWTLQVLLRNVLDNALHFRKREGPGTCAITVRQGEGEVRIGVQDDGIGISEEASAKAFDMFYKGSPQSPGSGLGLYNAALAARKLGGSIAIEPSQEGGTVLHITLPQRAL